MRAVGFSTGALAKGDFRVGIEMQRPFGLAAVELSALRDSELLALVRDLGTLDLAQFRHVSVHAPSELVNMNERDLIHCLLQIPEPWPIIVHPDIICEPRLWGRFAGRLYLENMDQRQPIGRTVSEMEVAFGWVPDANFCFDIGHARQVDPTMGIAIGLLKRFRSKLRQVHISEVDPYGRHIPISFAALRGFQRVSKFIPENCPVILEQSVAPSEITAELETVAQALTSFESVNSDEFPCVKAAEVV
jgi:hypothetical protein